MGIIVGNNYTGQRNREDVATDCWYIELIDRVGRVK